RRPGVGVNYWPLNHWPYVARVNCLCCASRHREALPVRDRLLLRHVGWLLGLILLTASCPARPQAPPTQNLVAQIVFQGLFCGREGPRVQWLDDRLAVAQVLDRIRHDRTRISQILRQLDFTRQGIVAIRVGVRPPAGPMLALAQSSLSVLNGALRIRVRWRQPPPAPRRALPAISPCLLVAVPRGGYAAVAIVNTRDEVYGCAKVPGRRTPGRSGSVADSVTEHTVTEPRHRQ
ncbi:MAG TPA: hypothetical protein VFL97_06610, partial [Nitrococcus sp.]|nr:hypothetical protein [Nitrococcus sp.]